MFIRTWKTLMGDSEAAKAPVTEVTLGNSSYDPYSAPAYVVFKTKDMQHTVEIRGSREELLKLGQELMKVSEAPPPEEPIKYNNFFFAKK